jgi:hypothetical protein
LRTSGETYWLTDRPKDETSSEGNIALSPKLKHGRCTNFSCDITYLLTPWSRVLLKELFCSYSRNSQHFRNPKVPHRTHQRPPPVPILSQLHPVPPTPSHFLKIHLNIILPSTFGSPQWSLSLRLPNQNPVRYYPN